MYRSVLALMLGLDAESLQHQPAHWALPPVPIRHPALAQFAWKLLVRAAPTVQALALRDWMTVSAVSASRDRVTFRHSLAGASRRFPIGSWSASCHVVLEPMPHQHVYMMACFSFLVVQRAADPACVP